jgi:hypothetical protein
MADLLADQGDYLGALEIYRELAAASAGSEARELAGLIAKMQAKIGKGAGGVKKPQPAALPGKEKLLSTLEALAERLEARAAL